MPCPIFQDTAPIIPHQLLSRGERRFPEQWCSHPANRQGLAQVTTARVQGHGCAALLLLLLTLWLHPLLIHLWSLLEIDEALDTAGAGSSVSSARTPCPGVGNESAAIWACHVLQPWGRQPLEAATLHDPRSHLSLKSETHFPSGTVLERSREPALPITQGTA